MDKTITSKPTDDVELLSGRTGNEFRNLFDEILLLAADGQLPLGIVGDFSRLLFKFFGCTKVEAIFRENQKLLLARTTGKKPKFSYLKKNWRVRNEDLIDQLKIEPPDRTHWLKSQVASISTEAANHGLIYHYAKQNSAQVSADKRTLQSYLFIPAAKTLCGIVVLHFKSAKLYDALSSKRLKRLISIIGLSYSHNRSRFELRERVKELTCMYNIANLSIDRELDIPTFLQQVVELLPPAYLSPEITEAMIEFDGECFQTPGFVPSRRCQVSVIMLDDIRRGRIEVIYREPMPTLDEGPFLAEERRLLDSVVSEIAAIIRHKEAEEAQVKLQEQLRHTDRLATIGKLAAGVAHELNEPLTGILGFAELLKEIPDMPQLAMSDIARIESAALHARDVVRKLLTFARQVPPKHGVVCANSVIHDVVSFFKDRCSKQNTRLDLALDEKLPKIFADESQIRQIILNLMVNALHAVNKGGRIRIATSYRKREICIALEDNGSGIADGIKDKIFLPFFTTKDLHKGTGMGLSVVDGIVKSHKGRIEVDTESGKGSKFKVFIPSIA